MVTFNKPAAVDRFDQLLTVLSVMLWALVLYYAYSQLMPRAKYGVIFLGTVLIIYITTELKSRLKGEDPLEVDDKIHIFLLILSAVITIVACTYLFVEFEALYQDRVGFAYSYEYWLAGIFSLMMIYLTWLSFGKTFVAVLVLGIAYGLFGNYIPGILGHGGFTPTRMLLFLVLEIEGFLGFLTRLVAAWVALFLLYAGLLEAYGAFDHIFRIATKSTKYVSSGVAQTAVLGSAIIGSVNGSQTANAGMTGSFTIPLMKRNGIRGSTAGGIEAVASTSGQVLPPVMGAGAFVMASLLGIRYVDVLFAGLLPAGILVVSIFVAVHYASIDQIDSSVMEDVVETELTWSEKITEAIRFGVPFVILIWSLGIAQYTVMTSGLYAVTSMLITGTAFPALREAYATRNTDEITNQARESIGDTIGGLKRGAILTAPIAIIIAAINGVVDVLVATGVPGTVTLTLMSLSGGIMLIAAILAMIICIVLGLGMPTVAAYTLVGLLVAPTLENSFLLPELAAHYFVFYGAILAGLTPPIATCAAVAAGIAEADFWKTSLEGIKIAAPLFILPFSFVYNPILVDGVFDVQTILLTILVLVGAISIAYGINYNFTYRKWITHLFSSVYIVLGIVAMVSGARIAQFVAVGVLLGISACRRSDVFHDIEALQPVNKDSLKGD